MQRPHFLVAIRRVEFVEDGNLQPWHRTNVESFKNTCLDLVGSHVSAPDFVAKPSKPTGINDHPRALVDSLSDIRWH